MKDEEDRAFVRSALAAHERPLLRFAASLVGRAHAADVVQDTFLALCKADRNLVRGHLAAWLFTVCRNRALDLKRTRGRLSELREEEEMQSPDSGPASRVERQQALGRIESALSGLSPEQRQAVILKFSGGLKYKEIAEVMELSATNVGFILHTALKALRTQLTDAGQELETVRSAP
jgi:RNA polymerase sigma factor (sigma-70 family)